MKRSFTFLSLFMGMLLSVFAVGTHAATDSGKLFTIARLVEGSTKVDKYYEPTKALADYLATELKEFGYTGSRVMLIAKQPELVRAFKEGKVDLFSDNVFLSAELVEEAGGELLVKAHRKDMITYRSVLFARKDSGINSPKDLLGRVVAFEDIYSTAGFRTPAGDLLAKGYALHRVYSPRQSVPPNAIGVYFTAGSESGGASMVHTRVVQASGIGEKDFSDDESVPPQMRQDMKIFHTSPELARTLVVARRDATPAFKQKLKLALQKAAKDPAMKSAMKGFNKAVDYSDLDKNDMQSYEEGKRMWKALVAAQWMK